VGVYDENHDCQYLSGEGGFEKRGIHALCYCVHASQLHIQKKYKKDKIYMRIDSPRMKLLICEPPRAITGLLPRVMREGRKCKTPNAMLYNQEYTEMQAQGNLRDDASSWPC
jgi:hypothetical protein